MADVNTTAPAEGAANTTQQNNAPAPAANTAANQGQTLLTTGDAANPNAPQPAAQPAPAPAQAKPAEPEAYELTAPEGYPINDDALKNLNALCRDAKLTRAQGEAVMKYLHGNYTAFQEGQAAQLKKWADEARADKEFGGDRFEANVADARRGLATFDTDGSIRAMLEETGYGNHPAVLKIFARVGKALGEDKLVGVGGDAAEIPLAERFYASAAK